MTQEEKQLLLKDLLPRQLYGVKAHYRYYDFVGRTERFIQEGDDVIESIDVSLGIPVYMHECLIKIENIKPYLRPMSSMTEEEIDEYHKRCEFNDCDYTGEPMYFDTLESFDYLYSIHVDCRGLIPMGLALEAPEGMYKTK